MRGIGKAALLVLFATSCGAPVVEGGAGESQSSHEAAALELPLELREFRTFLPERWSIPTPGAREHPGSEVLASDPRTYPDEAGFRRRAGLIIKALADNDLGTWRRGYFSGGDPGKYLPGHAMAKLLLNPDDPGPAKYQNDDRAYKEHYHFAAVNWGRFYPVFSDVLTPETKRRLAESAGRYSAYLLGGGTENHKTMWFTTANVLPYYIEGGRLAKRDKERALRDAKNHLRRYVKGLYAAGQGEWDSSTYLMFDVNGMLNIYDFSKDEECRLLAKAALDWLVAAYALKYRDGIYTAPNQRGYAPAPGKKIADNTGWLWWEGSREPRHEDMRGWRYTMHAVTSSWRPNQVITNIATKRLAKLPVEQRNSKPNYWFGLSQKPTPNRYRETVYVARHYTLASLWNGYGGQMSRMQLVADGPEGGIPFTGGHPCQHKYQDGNGRYDQAAQIGGTYVSMSMIPDDDPLAYSFFSIPDGATEPVRRGKWFVMRAGHTFVGLHPLASEAVIGESDLSEKQKQANEKRKSQGREPGHKPMPVVHFEGRRTGFVLETADTETVRDLDAFAALLARARLDASRFAASMELDYTNVAGRSIRMKYREGKAAAAVSVDGEPVTFDDWPVYGGPYVSQRDGVLSVNDGRDGFVIDFTGELPIYREWAK